MRMSIGIQNNNPLNIRYSVLNRWLGLRGNNKGFCVFDSMEHGLRAGIITLRTYICKHRLTSVKAIVSRFAPPSENATRSYISYVSMRLSSYGYNPDDIKFGDKGFLLMVVAMCMFESWYRCSENDIYNIIVKFKLH